jgi:hypothetical protein
MLNVGSDSMDINSATLRNIGVPGGGGLLHRFQEFTAPTVVTTTAFIPFFGFTPLSFGASQVLASYSVNKPGYDVGAGIEFGTIKHGKLFAEARYDHMFLNNGHTDFVPVTLGFRWQG